VQEGDSSYRCQNRGAWVQEGDHVLPASKLRGIEINGHKGVEIGGGAFPVSSIVG